MGAPRVCGESPHVSEELPYLPCLLDEDIAMSINVERRDQQAPGAVRAGLQQFTALPAWLEAAAQPERVQSALARSIPACAAGELTLEACEIKRLRFKAKTRCWTGSYCVIVAGPQPGQRRVVVLRGTIVPLGVDEPP